MEDDVKIQCPLGTLFRIVLWGFVIGLVLGLALAPHSIAALDRLSAVPITWLALSMS
ncbi:hypothetical protein [Saccharopolyspora shandongensis]|uniref:hypothetical protein n=1 Tax=Saccharopolyspora shandongensis TaxID=418495 RepID=UPI0033C11642